MTKRKVIWAGIFSLFISLLLQAAPAFSSGEYQFHSIQFYEGALQGAEPNDNFQTTFSQSTARCIYGVLTVVNLLQGVREHRHNVTMRYIDSAGTVINEQTTQFFIKPEWQQAWIYLGYGWENPGYWPVGGFTAEFLVDGFSVGTAHFRVVGEAQGMLFKQVRFFEAAGTPPPVGSRSYSTDFNADASRFIYFEATYGNLLYGSRMQKELIYARYYWPDGSLMGEPELMVDIPPEWSEASLWVGFGWEQPGQWIPGVYRAEIFFGSRLVSTSQFVINRGSSQSDKGKEEKRVFDKKLQRHAGKKRDKTFKTAIVEFAERGELNAKDSGAIIAEWLTSSLMRTGVFEIYTRLSIQDVLKELQFESSAVIDEQTAARAGKIHGVEAIVTGSVIKFGSTVSVTVKLIDTETAKIIDSADIKVKSLDELSERIDDLAWELAAD